MKTGINMLLWTTHVTEEHYPILEMLKEAGYDNNLTLTLHLPPPSYARKGGEVIAAMLADVGVTAKIENVEWAQWLANVFKKNQFQRTIISHVEPMDIGRIYSNPDYYFGYDSADC